MIAIIGLFIILTLSLTVVRIGAIALELTGLSTDIAAFQAQSAFSGVGFTTSESESIVNHPLRRKIIRTLILLGSAGITSTVATLIVALIGINNQNITLYTSILAAGLAVIYFLARSKVVYKMMKKTITGALKKVLSLNIHDYQELLGIGKGYTISQFTISNKNWATGHSIKELELNKEGTLILSINRNEEGEEKVIIPTGDTVLQKNDRVTIYGRGASCQCLSNRPKGEKGEKAHQKHVELQAAEYTVTSGHGSH